MKMKIYPFQSPGGRSPAVISAFPISPRTSLIALVLHRPSSKSKAKRNWLNHRWEKGIKKRQLTPPSPMRCRTAGVTAWLRQRLSLQRQRTKEANEEGRFSDVKNLDARLTKWPLLIFVLVPPVMACTSLAQKAKPNKIG